MKIPWQYEHTDDADAYRQAVRLYLQDLARRVEAAGDKTPHGVVGMLIADMKELGL